MTYIAGDQVSPSSSRDFLRRALATLLVQATAAARLCFLADAVALAKAG